MIPWITFNEERAERWFKERFICVIIAMCKWKQFSAPKNALCIRKVTSIHQKQSFTISKLTLKLCFHNKLHL